MLEIKNLKVSVNENQILNGIDLELEKGKNYAILGENGSGKSSLSASIVGNPKYKITNGEILLNGENIAELSPEERSKKGLFLAFQNVPEIKGIKLIEFLRTIYNTHLEAKGKDVKPLSPFLFKRFIKKYTEKLNIPEEFLQRDLNVGFSGGEKRKIEILQMKLIEPEYIILDEIDSGLDLDAVKLVSNLIAELDDETKSFIIITHNFKIIEKLKLDEVIVLKKGDLIKKGDEKLIEEIKENGFSNL